MNKYYRFGEPTKGTVCSAFRSKKDLNDFLQIVGIPKNNCISFYEISGKPISDNGGPDGLEVLVQNYKEIQIK